jgi:hypothetical protein
MTFRVYKSFFKDDLIDDAKTGAPEDDSKFTGGHQKMLRTFNSSISNNMHRQNSLDR